VSRRADGKRGEQVKINGNGSILFYFFLSSTTVARKTAAFTVHDEDVA